MKLFFNILSLAAILCFSSCTGEEDTPPQTNPDAKLVDLELAVLEYGYDQLHDLCSSQDTNIVLSPLSLVSALYMTSDGAGGDTYSQMADMLHLEEVTPEQGRLYAEYLDKVANENTDAVLSVGNEVFVDPSRMQLAEEYQEQVRTHYGAQVRELDFATTGAVTEINSWVAEATNGRIDKVVQSIGQDELVFLINATYFKADWANAFPESSVFDRDFTTLTGSTVMVPTMHHDAHLANVVTDDYTAVELYFKDSVYSMTFVLPAEGVTPTQFLESYDSGSFAAWVETLDERMASSRIFLQMPKFELRANYTLNNSLKNLGMTDAFDAGKANFDRLGTSGDGRLFVSRVLHDVYLKIDEKGAEGAAATTVGVAVTSAPPAIIFDRPFLFLIKHRGSNVPVFMGVIRDPR